MPDHIADGPIFELGARVERRVAERVEQGREGVRFGVVVGGLFHGVLFGAQCLASQATCRCTVYSGCRGRPHLLRKCSIVIPREGGGGSDITLRPAPL